jgi:hypothetical protein
VPRADTQQPKANCQQLKANPRHPMNPLHQQIINHLKKCEASGNVLEILNYDSTRFEEGFTIANEMQNADLVKLLYSNFNKNLVVVELTLVGESKVNHG